ncbi:MAG: amino acid adenylation domain-containing protein [Terriglobia bacterium]
MGYWRERLRGAPAVLQLWTDHPRPSQPTRSGARQAVVLSESLTASLAELGKQEGASLFMTLLAAFLVLLYRYTGQTDLCVGTPIANRTRAETEGLIGFFVNTLVLRTDLSGDPSFRELLRRAREVALEAYAHQDLPFEKLVQALQPERSLNQTPLFQVMFVLQNAPADKSPVAGMGIRPLEVDTGTAKFDMTVSLEESEGRVRGWLEYSTELFEGETISRLIEHYSTLLASAGQDPGQRISTLPVLPETERHKLLVDWNDTRREYPQRCVHELFEEQAQRAPSAVALTFRDQHLTYGELNRRANRLAHQLQRLGVRLETRVGICLERDLEMVIGMLGTLKAGGAYVPLDAAYPKERLAFMLEDAGVQVVLTQESLKDQLPATKAPIFLLDEFLESTGHEDLPSPSASATLESLAYIMYTSGSTGRPKGVEVVHRGIVRLLVGTDYVRLGESEVLLQLSPISFDACTFEIWGALLHGGRCVLFPTRVPTPEDLESELKRQGVTTLWLTASLFNAVMDEAPQALSSVQQLLVGGEALSVPHVGRALRLLPATRLMNGYGPTECTTFSCCYAIRAMKDTPGPSIPIGRPIANTQVYILDGRMQPVPIGVVGELYIGGDGLARGYLNQPELTAEKFIPDPFRQHPGARLYRSGDVARYLPDGNIEFLGRLDNQVKIRGFRVELGEIEAGLERHADVKTAAVVLREDEPGQKRLVAYIVGRAGAAPTTEGLRSFLGRSLPEYMLPSRFEFLEAMPLTASGKADRRALPAPGESRPEVGEAFVAPRTELEEKVARIWCQLLRLDRVGIYDNFFDLGGNSLLATRVISAVRTEFRTQVPLRRLFEMPTVAGLAPAIVESQAEELGRADAWRILEELDGSSEIAPSDLAPRDSRGVEATDVSALYHKISGMPADQLARLEARLRRRVAEGSGAQNIPRRGGTAPSPLSFAQERLWFLDQLEPQKPVYNIAEAIEWKGPLNLHALRKALDALVARHESLRTVFQNLEGVPMQVVTPPRTVPCEVIDLRGPSPDPNELGRRLEEEARRPFDLSRDLMLRATLLQVDEDEYRLLLVIHHIATDGWSMGVLLRELGALYEAFRNGQPARLPDLPIQYRDFAQWQREWLQGEVLEKQLGYWRERLRGAPAVLQLWTDHPRPSQPTRSGARQAVVLSESLTASLAELGKQEGASLFMTLLAAFLVLLYRYTGQTDLCVGTPIANRTRAETEGLIGFFVNTLVLRTDLSGDPSFRELLRRAREVALEAYAHQDLPFEKLVQALQPERSLNQTPLFQVMFVLQNAPADKSPVAGMGIRPLEVDTGTAKFDMTVSLEESEGRVRGWLEYSTELFEGETISRLIEHYSTLLASAGQDPGQRISTLPVLPETERHKLLVDWNDTRREYPQRCVHELFEEQAQRAPSAVALTFRDQHLTYGELNRRANRLAHQLQRLGVRLETRVGICLERDLEMVIGMLGTLKAGGAYVPLDAAYPKERLAFMLEDAGVQVVLTQESLKDQLPATKAPIFLLDEFLESTGHEDLPSPSASATLESLAYIMYTSGSTGRPKGVEVVHRGIVRLLVGTDYVRLGESEVLLQLSPISFDACTFEIWGALLHGGRCVLFPTRVPTPEDLESELKRQGVTTLWLTASLFNAVMDEAPQALSSVQQLLVGGEALSVPHVGRALRLLPATRLMNGYGPTECTTFSCCYAIRAMKDTPGPSIPIGRPIANTQVYILDGRMQPVPIGVVGELYIGGDGLARGYLNQPELTAEKFIPDPFRQHPGARLYRSGDVARYLPDGNIEFLGRLDNQVKIRGFRVELGEIEAGLERHADVKTAAVVLREDEPGQKRLVAYIVGRAGAAPTTEGLRSFLGRSLPEYMLPSRFEFLEAMPLTASGKADRRALPAPGESRPEVGAAFVAPRTELEEKLARIWCQLLRLDRVGIYDNFFDLGGHSLLATRLLSQVEKEFGKTLSLASVFRAPAIQDLAALLSQPCSPEEIPGIVPIQPFGSRPPFFCVGAGPLFRSLAQELGVHQPFLSLGLSRNETNSLPVPFKLEDMAAVLVRKLREIQPKGPYFLGGWCADGVLAYETARQLLNEGGEVALLVLFDAENPNPLANDPRAPELKRHRLFKRIGFHLKNFRRARAAKRLAYLRDLLETRIIVWKLQTWQILYKLLLYTTGHIPSRFRDFDSMEFYAMCHYHPGRCPARVVLISADLGVGAVYSDRRLGWGEVVSGELDIHSVPCGHSDLFREPHVKTLARTLDTCLAEAQAKFTTSRV